MIHSNTMPTIFIDIVAIQIKATDFPIWLNKNRYGFNCFCYIASIQDKLTVYMEGKDAIPGDSVYSSFVSALEKSRKIIVVLSNSFLQSDRCRGLADLAGTLFRCPG